MRPRLITAIIVFWPWVLIAMRTVISLNLDDAVDRWNRVILITASKVWVIPAVILWVVVEIVSATQQSAPVS